MSVYAESRADKKLEKIIERIETPESGGYFVYHVSFPFPEKGFRNVYVIRAVNLAKKALITWIRFSGSRLLIPFYLVFAILPWKTKILEKWLHEYANVAQYYLETYDHPNYLRLQYYSKFTRELMKLVETFLVTIGISFDTARRVTFCLISLVEYDMAYFYRVLDLFSETTSQRLLDSPRTEVLRLVSLLVKREKHLHIIPKFESFGRLISYALWLPRINKAFKTAIRAVNFSAMQFDEADRYHVRNMDGYDYFGMSYHDRLAKWPLTQHTVMEVLYDQLNDQQLDSLFVR